MRLKYQVVLQQLLTLCTAGFLATLAFSFSTENWSKFSFNCPTPTSNPAKARADKIKASSINTTQAVFRFDLREYRVDGCYYARYTIKSIGENIDTRDSSCYLHSEEAISYDSCGDMFCESASVVGLLIIAFAVLAGLAVVTSLGLQLVISFVEFKRTWISCIVVGSWCYITIASFLSYILWTKEVHPRLRKFVKDCSALSSGVDDGIVEQDGNPTWFLLVVCLLSLVLGLLSYFREIYLPSRPDSSVDGDIDESERPEQTQRDETFLILLGGMGSKGYQSTA